jgi:glycosyltransferase involved in cell wall biosynthesis
MSKLSVVIITKNEEKNIRACLETIEWADELIIVDSFSEDKTVEIGKKFTDKIFLKKFINYSEQRNFADEKASNYWILALDADERITKELRGEIIKLINNDKSYYDGYYISTLDYMFGKFIKHGGWYPQYHIRLYKKEKAKWKNTVHEIPYIQGKISYLKNPILHFSHLKISNFIKKLNHYTSIEAKELYEIGYKPNLFRLIFWPFIVFAYKYIYKLGFLDGIHGIVLSSSLAYYHFARYAKTWELWFKKEHNINDD